MSDRDGITLGSVETFSGGQVDVILDEDGDVTLHRRDGRSREWIFTPPEQRKLRELLDRAAMPGQPEAAEVREGMCRNPRECPNGPDDHPFVPAVPGRSWCYQPDGEPPALTVAAVTPALAEAIGELADAAQEAGDDRS